MNAINWFEIVVTDIERGARFYEQLLGVELRREEFFGTSMALFPSQDPGAGGCLVRADDKRQPGVGGSVIYLNANGKLDACVDRVKKAGGSVIAPRTEIGDAGAFALVRDPDGNVIGLHAERQ
jgi:predicted enzyme related to lactoylglutathione lyase